MTTNPWLEGNYAPVTEEVTVADLEVSGRLPEELCGRYLRNGPNPLGSPEPSSYHWFTGDGMVHGMRLREGRAEWYRNRWVRSAEVARTLGEEPRPGPVHAGMDFAPNTNVIGHGGRTFAIVEAGALPYELSYELETVGPCDFSGALEAYSAHPKRDPLTGDLHVVSYFFGWGNQIRYTRQDPSGAVVEQVDVPTTGATSVHDVSITGRYVVLFDLPVVFDLEAAAGGGSFPYRWDPGYPSRVGLLPRQGSAEEVEWFEVEPCYVFHPVNSYDEEDRVVLDVVRHPKMFAEHSLGPAEGTPTLERWTLQPGVTGAKEERLDDRGQEFPRVDERLIGRRHRFAYAVGAEFAEPGSPLGSSLLRHDLERQMTSARPIKGSAGTVGQAGEAVFVPRSEGGSEDEGWLLAVAYDPDRDASDLLVVNGEDFTGAPEAVVHLPVRVPHGFHGNWVADR